MNNKILLGLVLVVSMTVILTGCESQQEVQLPAATQLPQMQIPQSAPPGVVTTVPETQQIQQPVANVAPVATVAPVAVEPPDTPLIPIGEEETAKTSTGTGTATGVCKLSGPATNGDELIPHNFLCQIDTKDLPFGLKPPAFSCRVQRTGGDKLILTATGQRGSVFTITETKLSGFKIDGTYSMSGQKLQINNCMKAKGVGKYSGSGNGILNGDKKNRFKYTLTMAKQ